jgi:flagellar basal body P-ring protein FlgI
MDNKITLELKQKDYEKILDIIRQVDDKLYKKILIARDDDYVPHRVPINKIDYYEFHEDEPEPEFEVSVDSAGFWMIK